MTLTIEIPKGSPVLILRNLPPAEAERWYAQTLLLDRARREEFGIDTARGQVRKENA